MHLEEALSQIAEIRGHLTRSEAFRGTRAAWVAASAGVAVAAAALQSVLVPDPAAAPLAYVGLWLAAAAAALSLVGTHVLVGYLRCASLHERATTRQTVGQIVPALLAAALVTAALAAREPSRVAGLPGLWSVFAGVGVFAARERLPRSTGVVGLYYVAAGSFVLWRLEGSTALEPWVMGLTFGAGQLAAALVFYWNQERRTGHDNL